MSGELPNHIYIHNGIAFGVRFGGLHEPIGAIGGMHPHLRLRFDGGLYAELDPSTATTLTRQLPAALNALTALGGYTNCAGTVWGGDDQ